MQELLDLLAVEGGVASFGTRSPEQSVALLDVIGAEATLASADDATQEEVLAGRSQFLDAQAFPFQVLVRAEPVDLDGHVKRELREQPLTRWRGWTIVCPGDAYAGRSDRPERV